MPANEKMLLRVSCRRCNPGFKSPSQEKTIFSSWRSGLSPFLLSRNLVALLLLLATSCATARLNQFKEFSQAGIAYADATGLLIEEAGAAAIDGDSTILIRLRQNMAPEKRQKAIVEHNALLKKRLSLLADLRRHANLLKAYFIQLGALADRETRGDLGRSADGVFQALGDLNSRIRGAEIGGRPVSDFIGPVVEIVVGNFRKNGLESELRNRVETLERELEIQQSAMSFISEDLEADLQVRLQSLETERIIDPFQGSGTLPSGWKEDRKTVLTSTLLLSSVAATADAAKNLKMSFVALVEGRETNIAALVQDIGELVAFLEAISEGAEE